MTIEARSNLSGDRGNIIPSRVCPRETRCRTFGSTVEDGDLQFPRLLPHLLWHRIGFYHSLPETEMNPRLVLLVVLLAGVAWELREGAWFEGEPLDSIEDDSGNPLRVNVSMLHKKREQGTRPMI